MTASSQKQKEKQIKTKRPPTFQTQFPVLSFSFVISFNLFGENTPGQGTLIAGIINLKRGKRKVGNLYFSHKMDQRKLSPGKALLSRLS